MEPTEDELHQWRTSAEDHFIERKTAGDHRDWAKTVVAFANSLPHDAYGILYIGVRDDGAIEPNINVESAQQKLRRYLELVYPPVRCMPRVIAIPGFPRYVCVLVPGSPERPHFAGPAYERKGSSTVIASDSAFNALVSERLGKTYHIRQFIGHCVRVELVWTEEKMIKMFGRIARSDLWTIAECDQFSVVCRDQYGNPQQIALSRVDVLLGGPPKSLTLQIRH